jgi:hypothetical protein
MYEKFITVKSELLIHYRTVHNKKTTQLCRKYLYIDVSSSVSIHISDDC